MDFIKLVEEDFKSGKQLPKFAPGDTIVVDYRIKEGNKERIQKFRGTVIRISGHGDQRRFTVRKISDGVGVERIFPFNSPFIEEIHVERHGKVRRAKLYYLRERRGKAARIRERRTLSASVK
ncbi:50S ribosomal protein L19 [Porphyromonas sp.]|uniref:50S ribosomal protein L19 n=1 Tax=Porphyromonas sp. TaxID=1924944 RepID=UPI0025CC9C36|nr:50S ribosomal protein L19 [Porphyromonas sp.]